jgi:hypothetical protein
MKDNFISSVCVLCLVMSIGLNIGLLYLLNKSQDTINSAYQNHIEFIETTTGIVPMGESFENTK